MTTLERVKNLASKVTYKPGWGIDVSYGPNESWEQPVYEQMRRIYITVSWKAKDIFDPQKEIMLCWMRSLTHWDVEHLNDAQIVDYFIYRAIFEAEEHEIKEWFKFDGIQVRDPHPELKESMVTK